MGVTSGLGVAAIGLGSNLLVADDGLRRRSSLKLAGELAADRRGRRAPRRGRRGAERGLPAPCARGRPRRLRVRLRDPGHGGRGRVDERRRVRRRLGGDPRAGARRRRGRGGLAHAERARALLPALGARGTARWSPGSSSGSRRVPPRRSRRSSPTCRRSARLPSRRTSARSGASSRIPSTSCPRAGCSRRAGCKGHRIGGAQISPRHANFIENAGDARSADAIALMAEARRRAWDQFGLELEHEVEFLGPLELPPLEQVGTRARGGEVTRVSEKVLRLPRKRGLDVLRLAPSGRSLAIGVGVCCSSRSRLYALARGTSMFAVQAIEVEGASPALAADVRAELELLRRPQPRRRQRRLGRAARRRAACSAERHRRSRVPAHA